MPIAAQLRPLSGAEISPLGLSATYLPSREAVYVAIDEGINIFFTFGIDFQMIYALRNVMKSRRKDVILVTGAYNYIWWAQDVRKACEKRLRQFQTDYIDAFLFMGVMKSSEFTDKVYEDLLRLKEEGKVRAIGLSCHDRKFLGSLAQKGTVDVLMLRYNAAHRGAEQDIFPHLPAHNPFVLSYTATRWTALLRRPKGYPKDARIPTAGECYRFVLSNPNVNAVLTAPRNVCQLKENIDAIHKGPLSQEDLKFMKDFGDIVHKQKKWFM